jgi:hypothetical protein
VGIRSKNGMNFPNPCGHNWWGRSRLEEYSTEVGPLCRPQVGGQPLVARAEEGHDELAAAEDGR